MRIIFFLIAFTFLLFSCKKDYLTGVQIIRISYTDPAVDSLCEHYEIYADSIMKNTISCDSLALGRVPMYDFKMKPENFNAAKALFTEIPEAYWESPNFRSIGNCCADCGEYSFEITRNGETKSTSWQEVFCDEDNPDKATKEVIAKVRVLLVALRK
jgi:hypothetical protein